MNTSYAKAETLLGTAFAPIDWTRAFGLVLACSVLTAMSAQVAIPLASTPVPITLQTFLVLLTGALLGSRLGAIAMMAYLFEGAIGLPFFAAGGAGIGRLLFSPTSGYLLSYPAAAFVTGALAERGWDKRFGTAAAAIAIGSLVILVCGWSWFAIWTKSPVDAFRLAVLPFIPGDIVKIVLAAIALPSGWAIMRRFGHSNN